MQGTVSGLVASYGYVVLFFLVGLESLGLPLPGETALVTAAAFAALGHLSIYGVVTTAVAAAVIGGNGGCLVWGGGGGEVGCVGGGGSSEIAGASSHAPSASRAASIWGCTSRSGW